MTQPNSTTGGGAAGASVSKSGSGGIAGAGIGGLNRPAEPPKMSDEQLRLECAKLAVQAGVLPNNLISTAQSIHSFVKGGS